MPKNKITRREFLVSADAIVAGAAACSVCPEPVQPDPTTTSSAIAVPTYAPTPTTVAAKNILRRVLRIGHLSDIHLDLTENTEAGMVKALDSIQSQEDPPDFFLNTGDSIMNAFQIEKEYVIQNWEIFRSILENHSLLESHLPQEIDSLPIYHVIGNHDIWVWGHGDPSIQGDPLYGKGMALKYLGLEKGYYSFDRGGWHFIVLDSTYPLDMETDGSYTGKLDEVQFTWLEDDLALTPSSTPVCIASHIPIITACEFFDGPNESTGNWVIPGSWMHIDARRFRELFLQHKNVRLCLSGHAHQVDAIEYLGVQYFCDGAVSGWWNEGYIDCPPSYAMINLYEDGSVDREVIAY